MNTSLLSGSIMKQQNAGNHKNQSSHLVVQTLPVFGGGHSKNRKIVQLKTAHKLRQIGKNI
jgi:hypothetical protein